MKNDIQANGIQKQAGVVLLISVRTDFKITLKKCHNVPTPNTTIKEKIKIKSV
jgi:hypothetical protein